MWWYATIFIAIAATASAHQQQQNVVDDTTGQEESNPFFEAAKSFLSEALENQQKDNSAATGGGGLAAMGGLLQQFLQKDGGKQLGDIFTGGRAAGNNNGADILSGIASIFAESTGKSEGGGQGLDPSIIGHVAELITNVISTESPKTDDDDLKTNEIPSSKDQQQSSGQQQQFDWNSALQIASAFMPKSGDDGQSSSGALEGLLNLLPLLSSGLSGSHVHFADAELEDKEEHEMFRKPSFLPPFLNNLYEYWEHFKTSDLGQTLWSNSGLENIFQLFIDKDGYFQVDRVFESMENTSFRRKWIKSLSTFVGGWVKHLSDPLTQAR